MKSVISGCNIHLSFAANELNSHNYVYTLPPGYSINTIHIASIENITIINRIAVRPNDRYIFPIINSKSPSTITLYISDLTKYAEIRFVIEKFGQIPDEYYFDTAFEPILVTGDDGNKYKVIPSDQFN